MNRQTLISKLPPVKGTEKLIVSDQDVIDIMKEVLDAHREFCDDYDQICQQFEGGSVEKKLYDYCRRNLSYVVEKEESQSTCSPAALLKRGHCDCKGYAGFIAGILDALNRSGWGDFDWCYRFGFYEQGTDTWHVFVVVKHPDNSETWIDPVLSGFNRRDPVPIKFTDKKVSPMLTRVSGPGRAMSDRSRPAAPTMIAACSPLCGYATVGQTPGFTPQQLGIPIGQNAFNLQNLTPGAAAALAANPPYRFYDGNTWIPLPPVVTPGAQVPALPQHIRVVWADSFMGVPIPTDMLNVANNQGSLIIWPREIMSAGGTPAGTNNLLWANNKVLAFLMLAVLENLIYSYSPHPWGNTYGDLADYLHNHRDYDNWLRYPYEDKGTFFQEALKAGINTYETVFLKPTSAVINTIVPGAGTAGLNLETGLFSQITGGKAPATPAYPQAQIPGQVIPLTNQLQTPPVGSMILSFAKANPVVTVGLVAAVGLFLYELLKKD